MPVLRHMMYNACYMRNAILLPKRREGLKSMPWKVGQYFSNHHEQRLICRYTVAFWAVGTVAYWPDKNTYQPRRYFHNRPNSTCPLSRDSLGKFYEVTRPG